MKKLTYLFIFCLMAFSLSGTLSFVNAQNGDPAQVQIIHNSPDPAVALVDVYVNDTETPLLTEVPFRGATGFLELDAELEYTVYVTPSGEAATDGIVFSGLTFEAGENYYIIASGVLDPEGFSGNPDEIDTEFFLDVIAGAELELGNEDNVQFKAYHGAPDAPAVDIVARGVATLESDFAYTDASEEYIEVPAASYIIDINVAGTPNTAASFTADLSGLGGGSALVLASGFLSPEDNQDGPAFGVIAVLPDGTVLELPAAEPPVAQVQIIHNAADPAVAEVDIYVNDDSEPLLSEVPFRGATGFLSLNTNISYEITITPAGASPEDGFTFSGITLEAGENYYIVATGVADPGSFADNPDGVDTGFFLDIISGAELAAASDSDVSFVVYHGATDAPAVDVIARDVATLEENLAYTDASEDYITVPANDYVIDINVAGTETTAASFEAPLSGLGGQSLIVLASGFLSPEDNQDGPAFGLIAVLTDGTVVLLPMEADEPEPARVQIIHNSPDPAVAEVDIYVNSFDEPFLSNVPFRGATGFVELDPEVTYDITVTPAGAAPEAGFTFSDVMFEAGVSYYVVATGVADPGAFADNPDGVDTGFFLDIIEGAETESDDSETVWFKVYHGATDAPAVDVVARNVAVLESGLAYTDVSDDYIAVPADAYIIDINVAGTENTAAAFDADLSGLGGGAAIVLASGFLSPADNQDGPGFGLIAVLGDGTVVELMMRTNIEDPRDNLPQQFDLSQNYPNPFNPTTQINYSLPEAADVRLDVYNISGQRVATLVNGSQNAGSYTVSFDASNLASGLYLYRITAGNFTQVKKMMLVK